MRFFLEKKDLPTLNLQIDLVIFITQLVQKFDTCAWYFLLNLIKGTNISLDYLPRALDQINFLKKIRNL